MKAQSIEEYELKDNKCIYCPFLIYLKHCKHNIFLLVLCTFLFCMLVCTHSDVANADNYYFCFLCLQLTICLIAFLCDESQEIFCFCFFICYPCRSGCVLSLVLCY